jgi:hypothetical protein
MRPAAKTRALCSQTRVQMVGTFRREWLHNALVFGNIFFTFVTIMLTVLQHSSLLSVSSCTLLFFPKVFLGFGFWTFINVQKQDMEKSLGKTLQKKSFTS